MKNDLVELIRFPSHDTKNGVLTMFECGELADKVPFAIKRVLVINDMKDNDQRGGHTHHETHQILFCLTGACSVTLDNGKEKQTVRLDNPQTGLYLPPYVWHTMQDFAPGTILLVLASTVYDEKEYIRNYEDFLTFTKKIL